MERVLISFLGTGSFNRTNKGEREYRTAKYHIDNKEYKTSFVSAALIDHFDIDKKIVIGTVKSMWEEYYRVFKEKDEDFNTDLYFQISEFTDKSTYKTESFPIKDSLEEALHNTKIIILKYGLNEAELEDNLLKIIGIEEYLNNGDDIYIDVTHGFRSFPLFAQEILLYIKHVTRKQIVLKKFLYGMLDVTGEIGYTPIVDLSVVQRMNDWLVGVNEFVSKSDGSKLVELLKPRSSELSKLIDNFSKAFNINYSHEIKKQYEKILKQDFNKLNPLEKLIAEKGFNEFREHFDLSKRNSLFQLDLAYWYYKKSLYGVSYLTLTESIITYVAEGIDLDKSFDMSIRERAKNKIYKKHPELGRLYNTVNKIRKNVAHMLDKRHDTYLNDIVNLEHRINEAKKLMI